MCDVYVAFICHYCEAVTLLVTFSGKLIEDGVPVFPSMVPKPAGELLRVSKVFWGQSKNEIKVGGSPFQTVKLGVNFRGLK